MTKVTIPPVSREELEARQARIRMVGPYFVKGKTGPTELHYLERRPLHFWFWLVGCEELASDIEPLTTITTRHPIRGDGSFDPGYDEYYSQIPEELLDQVVAIEHSGHNLTVVDGMHEVQTTLYKRKS